MGKRIYLLLIVVSAVSFLGIAVREKVPGYMDADYYYATGLRIATNKSWEEPFLWNYLSGLDTLPHPAFTYWMPIAGVITAIGIKISGLNNFWGARIGFIILSCCAVALSAFLSTRFTRKGWAALLTGLIAICSGFYFAYLPTTDTFAVYMFLGSVFILLLGKLQNDANKLSATRKSVSRNRDQNSTGFFLSPLWTYGSLGVVSGLMYLTRADGIIWLAMASGGIIMQARFASKYIKITWRKAGVYNYLLPMAVTFGIFLVVISPWIIRNLNHFGSIFAPGLSRAMWLSNYDQLFVYPASGITFQSWLDPGLAEILKVRGWALGMNLLTTFAVQGTIFLLPFILMGIWVNRKDWRVIIGVSGWLAVLILMTGVFPFQGARGGFFHAGAGFQPLFWALIPSGLEVITSWAAKIRTWESKRAITLFSIALIGLSILVTTIITWQRLNGGTNSLAAWGERELSYLEVEAYLKSSGADPEDIVMANNPPGYYAMNNRPAIVIPDGDLNTTLDAARKFDAQYLILDEGYPSGLEDVYRNPGDYPGIVFLDTRREIQIYSLEP